MCQATKAIWHIIKITKRSSKVGHASVPSNVKLSATACRVINVMLGIAA